MLMKTLVVYYSRTGKTRYVAERISEKLGAEIEEIIDLKNRRGALGFIIAGYDATRGKDTMIAKPQKSPKDFDLIIIGTPVWNGRPTPAVRTYLKNSDLNRKKVAVFCTNEGRDGEKAIARLKALLPNDVCVSSMVMTRPLKNKVETQEKISAWISSLHTAPQ
jgi:flavodoxin